jgi:hypothetical protein
LRSGEGGGAGRDADERLLEDVLGRVAVAEELDEEAEDLVLVGAARLRAGSSDRRSCPLSAVMFASITRRSPREYARVAKTGNVAGSSAPSWYKALSRRSS